MEEIIFPGERPQIDYPTPSDHIHRSNIVCTEPFVFICISNTYTHTARMKKKRPFFERGWEGIGGRNVKGKCN